jgi:hypothetical protein
VPPAPASPPQGTYHRVVCSVCGGQGVVRLGQKAGPSPAWLRLLLAASLLLGTVGLATLSAAYLLRELHRDEDVRENVRKTIEGRRRSMSVSEVTSSIPVGLPEQGVEAFLGDPDRKHEMGSGMATLAVWDYECADGKVRVTIQDGKVIAVGR